MRQSGSPLRVDQHPGGNELMPKMVGPLRTHRDQPWYQRFQGVIQYCRDASSGMVGSDQERSDESLAIRRSSSTPTRPFRARVSGVSEESLETGWREHSLSLVLVRLIHSLRLLTPA